MAKVNLSTIKEWFKTGLKPTQKQFRDSWDSFWHKDEKIPVESIENIDAYIEGKTDGTKINEHIADPLAHYNLFDQKVDKVVGKRLSTEDFTTDSKNKLFGIQTGAETNVQADWDALDGDAYIKNKPAIPTQTIVDNVLSSTSENPVQNKAIEPIITSIGNKTDNHEISISNLALSKIALTDIVDNLTSIATNKPLSANQGKILKSLIDNISAILLSDDTTLNEIQEIVNYIKQNKTDLQNLDIINIAGLNDILTGLANDITILNTTVDTKVDKVTGKGLSSEDFTTDQKGKLTGIETGAQANIQGDWQAANGDSFIKNKPIIPTQTVVDTTLSSTSTNPVQNKVIEPVLNSLTTTSDSHTNLILSLEVSKIALTDIVNHLTSEFTDKPLSAKQGNVLKSLIDNIDILLTSNDVNLNDLQKIVDFIKQLNSQLQNLDIADIEGLELILFNLNNDLLQVSADLDKKVDKVLGKGLSTEDFTTNNLGKLIGIQTGAEVNVQSDWKALDGDSFIKNKPTIPTQTTVDSALSGTSTNPVQNKVIEPIFESLNSKTDSHALLISGLETSKIALVDIVNHLTSIATNKPLSAKQGEVLKSLIDNIYQSN